MLQVDVSDVIPEDSVLIASQFVPDLNAVCYATTAGDLVVFHVEEQQVKNSLT